MAMPHIHTDPGEHDTTASAFIIRLDGPEPRILLHVHKKLGILLQPGGHVELKETPWQAILHEITEETGFRHEQLKILQPQLRLRQLSGAILHPAAIYQITHHFDGELDHWHTDTGYAFLADGDPIGKPDDNESTDLRWYTESEIEAIPVGGLPENVRDIARYALSDCLPNWEPLPLDTYAA